jgi:hypothetical protein
MLEKKNSQQFLKLFEKYKTIFSDLKNWTKIEKIDPNNIVPIYDALNAMNEHKLLKVKEILDNFNLIRESSMDCAMEIYSSDVVGKLGGGPLLNEILKDMIEFISKKSSTRFEEDNLLNFDIFKNKNLKLTPPTKLKYIHYSGHDITM